MKSGFVFLQPGGREGRRGQPHKAHAISYSNSFPGLPPDFPSLQENGRSGYITCSCPQEVTGSPIFFKAHGLSYLSLTGGLVGNRRKVRQSHREFSLEGAGLARSDLGTKGKLNRSQHHTVIDPYQLAPGWSRACLQSWGFAAST